MDEAIKFSTLITRATLYGIHPDRPLTDESNAHAKLRTDKHAELSAMWKALKPEYRELYGRLSK